MRRWLVGTLLMAAACAGPRSETDDEKMGVMGGLDTSRSGLTQLVQEGGYQGWTKEPLVHKSQGPHGQVRTYFNDVLRNSLKVGAAIHPVGSASVKELYDNQGASLLGHAVMVKVTEEANKDSWLFYEGFAPDYLDPYYGRGHATCHGCHASGKDYVVSAVP